MITGHRPNKLGGYKTPNATQTAIRAQLRNLLAHWLSVEPGLEVISGMALGVDQWWAEEAMELNIPVHAFIPFWGQESKWPAESQAIYRGLLSRCATVQASANYYSAAVMQTRNIDMVNAANWHVAVWDGSSGGTGNCVAYMKSKGIAFVHIDPRTVVS